MFLLKLKFLHKMGHVEMELKIVSGDLWLQRVDTSSLMQCVSNFFPKT